jgi:catechol 2,3-dioxygenase-like lactoylglutathione lyase family enzyme
MSDDTKASAKTGAWAQGIQAITLFTEDLHKTKAFYQMVFGLPIYFEDSDLAVFQFGGTLINLLKITEAKELIEPAKVASRDSGSRFVFTIGMGNVDAMCAELIDRGVELLNSPMDRPWGVRTASFMDPAGYIWEIAN